MGAARARAGRRRRVPPAALLLLLAGAWLRWRVLAVDLRFTPDEAFFSTFARAAAVQGDWWLSGTLDKTPLALYANALAQVAVGPLEQATRLPGVLASILLLALLYVLTRDLYPHSSPTLPTLALLLAACSPLLATASASALTDGLMLTCVTAALWLAVRGRLGWSGLLFGLALASKQQALFVLPLILWAAASHVPLTSRRILRFALALAFCVALLQWWDFARPGASINVLAFANNSPEGLAEPGALPARLRTWLGHAAALFWPGWPGGLLLFNGLLALCWRARSRPWPQHIRTDLAPALFIAGYSLLQLLPAFPLYARYVLLLLPALLPLCARGLCCSAALLVSRLAPLQGRSRPALLVTAVLLLMLQPVPDPDPHAGIDELGAWLAARPVATVVYDRWLGWQLGFYLGTWHDKRVTWYPVPAALAADARRLCEFGPRYLPAPRGVDVGPWLEAMRAAGFAVTLAWENDGYEAWQFTPPWREQADCPASP